MKNILELKKVCLTYQTVKDETEAVSDLSFTVKEGEFVSLIGPSGCGKTTVLSLISGLIPLSGGEIKIDGKPAGKGFAGIGYMLQKDHLFPWRTIEKNVFLPLEIKKSATKERKEYALSLLKKYGLYEFKDNYPDELSGGMRQRAALIRTLVSSPEILLLDEPFSAIDYQTRLSVCNDVYSIIKAENKTAILVTHDISEAVSMSDKIVVLSKRPASVKKIFTPNIAGNSPLERRESPESSVLFEKIWKELN